MIKLDWRTWFRCVSKEANSLSIPELGRFPQLIVATTGVPHRAELNLLLLLQGKKRRMHPSCKQQIQKETLKG